MPTLPRRCPESRLKDLLATHPPHAHRGSPASKGSLQSISCITNACLLQGLRKEGERLGAEAAAAGKLREGARESRFLVRELQAHLAEHKGAAAAAAEQLQEERRLHRDTQRQVHACNVFPGALDGTHLHWVHWASSRRVNLCVMNSAERQRIRLTMLHPPPHTSPLTARQL